MTDIVTVHGTSDDLIEIDGAIREELYPFSDFTEDDDTGAFVAFSDGTVLEIIYGSRGMWRIRRVAKGTAEYRLDEATDEVKNYSDVATLTGDLRWAVLAKQFITPSPVPTMRDHHMPARKREPRT